MSLGLISCTDPIRPEFEFKEGLVYIEALASTGEGASFVRITESALEFGIYESVFLNGASVFFVNGNTNEMVQLAQEEELYVPPVDFKVGLGETWELQVTLPDGRFYKSEPERAENAVAIQQVDVEYTPELEFNAGLDRFIPGHRISIGFEDPPDQENYYYWSYRSFERLVNCKVCFNGFYREEMCMSVAPIEPPITKPYYTYACESTCWQIRYEDNINIFSDKFTNGTTVSQLSVAEVPLINKRNILVELQQFSISASAHEYYRTLKDIIDDNSGFNAPLPAALVGNMSNPGNDEEFVLGRFTVAATTTTPIFIERIFIDGPPLETELFSSPEEFGDGTPDPKVTTAPCGESRYRTSFRPEGWRD